MPKYSLSPEFNSSLNKEDCKPGLLITLDNDEEITDELIQSIHPLEKYVTFTRENNQENREKAILRKENPLRILLTKEGLRGRHFKRLHFSWINEGLRDEIFENVTIDSLHLSTPLDSPFEEYPTNIAKLTKNPNFVLKISGYGIPTYGKGFEQLIDERREKEKENNTKPVDQREKIYDYIFYC